jgi:steroid delta-isomerase-like uncharacterized protein
LLVPDQNKELIRRWIAFANTGFPGALDEYIAGDYVGHLPGFPDQDRAELERLERAFVKAFPDTKHSIEDLFAEGDRVVLRVISRGTHLGQFEGIAATGRRVEFTGMVIYRISNGRIAESWGEMDFARLMRQLTSRSG